MELALRADAGPYFRFREPRNISIHIKSVQTFLKREQAAEEGAFECDMSWIDRDDRSNTELLVTAWNRPFSGKSLLRPGRS